jgi:predicted alpha/beta hydrolase family esterase
MVRVFLVHGWEGSPDNHWFPWLKAELEKCGFFVESVVLPDAHEPHLTAWLSALSKAVGVPDKDTYFVGHSLGCISIVRYLSKLPENVCVGGVVSVAGFSSDLGSPEISEFTRSDLDFNAVKIHSSGFVNIFSDNDRYVPLTESRMFAEKLGAYPLFAQGKGHFSSTKKGLELPVAREAVLSLIEKRTVFLSVDTVPAV